jgi:hypothetical protein
LCRCANEGAWVELAERLLIGEKCSTSLDPEARPNGEERFAAHFDTKRGSNSTLPRAAVLDLLCAEDVEGIHRRLADRRRPTGLAGWRSQSVPLSRPLIQPIGPLAFRDTLSRCAPFRIVAGVAPWAIGETESLRRRETQPACTPSTSHPHSSH